jgi:heme-degrading monooxygenase HmoA
MAQAYTHSVWIVKPGLEDEFIQRWREFATWSALQGLAGGARLLRDVDQRNRFVSFAPWQSFDTVGRWRSARGFHERIGRLQEVLESFEPHTLEQIAEI